MPNRDLMPSRDPQPQRSLPELLRELEHLQENPPENKSQGRVIPRGHSLTESPLKAEIEMSLNGKNYQLAPNGNTHEVWLSRNHPTLYNFRLMGSVVITIYDGYPAIAFQYIHAAKWETVVLSFPYPEFRPDETLLLAMAIVSGDLLEFSYGELIPHLDANEFNRLPDFSPMAVVGLQTKIESLEASNERASNYYAQVQTKLQTELETMKAKDVANCKEIASLQQKVSYWECIAKMFIVFFLLACAMLWLLAIWAGYKNNPEKTARLGMWHTTPHAYLANGAVGPLGTPALRR